MKFSHLATTFLWLAPLVLLCVIAVTIFVRRLAWRYPLFLAYTVLLPTRDAILLFLPYAQHSYSTVYWWGEAGAVLLSLGVIAETIWHLIAPYPFIRIIFRVFWAVAILAGGASLAILLWGNGPAGPDLSLERIILLQRSARFLQVCMLIAAIGLMSRLGLTWHHYSLGITVGFGVYAALDLALLEFRANLHVISDNAFVLLRSSAYNLAVLIWAFYFLRRRRVSRVDHLPSTDVANWNDTLTEQIEKWYRR